MDIILLENIEKVGSRLDIVKVKAGYGRNFLLPRGMAIVANKPNLGKLAGMKKSAAKKDAANVAVFKQWAAKLADNRLTIPMKATDAGHLYGSVTAANISDLLKEMGIVADKRIIEMPEEVKELGSYSATVHFHPDVEGTVNFKVVGEKAGKEVAAPAPEAAPAPVAVAEPAPVAVAEPAPVAIAEPAPAPLPEPEPEAAPEDFAVAQSDDGGEAIGDDITTEVVADELEPVMASVETAVEDFATEVAPDEAEPAVEDLAAEVTPDVAEPADKDVDA